MTDQRLRIEISGAVQGVGFRPFVYRLAGELHLPGWVLNDTSGVFIEVEGDPALLDRFLERLTHEYPPNAQITSLTHTRLACVGYTGFDIRHSAAHGTKTALILPDLATCPECLAEILSPADRRFRYPFTNCTNCGPRFTIITDLPYDRPNTTMRGFLLCPACRSEYESPLDRRFHAQPNACPLCGPQIRLLHPDGTPTAHADQSLRAAAAALQAGAIIAVKGLGGFHLMADANNTAAVALLRARKQREEKPFALLARDLAQAHTLCTITPEAETLLSTPQAPIVLLPRRSDAPVAPGVAPHNPFLGVMLPAMPLQHLLLRELNGPLVATSGNRSDEPICTDEHEALERLTGIADGFLVHNRPIERHVDDSIATILDGAPRLLRRARGYAPLPIRLAQPAPCILAVGAHLKNSVALSIERSVFVSQHIGDLETPQAHAAFERVIRDFLRMYDAHPTMIACDLHPAYASTRFARAHAATLLPPDGRIVAVQHHHAHLAACLAEHGEAGPALGIIWDGTGYGTDGTIWGGEFLLGDARSFQRVAHLAPFRLPGGEAAIRNPLRTALALLWELEGSAALERPELPLTDDERRLLGPMLARGINSPRTTSAGRLFDGVSALLGICRRASYEGQPAIMLEFAADPQAQDVYPFELRPNESIPPTLMLCWQPTLAAILADLRHGLAPAIIAGRFHTTMIEVMVRAAQHIDTATVALSGGCFQNRLLTERAAQRLRAAGFRVLLHRQVPPNDGGISLGQIAVAAVT